MEERKVWRTVALTNWTSRTLKLFVHNYQQDESSYDIANPELEETGDSSSSDSSDQDIERLSQRIDIGESSYSSSCDEFYSGDEDLASTESDRALPGGVVYDAIRVRAKIINWRRCQRLMLLQDKSLETSAQSTSRKAYCEHCWYDKN